MTPTISRRQLIAATGAGAGLLAVGAAGALAVEAHGDTADAGTRLPDAVDFYGEHQAGIVTPAQDRLHFVAFDVITDDRAKLVAMLQDWSIAAARMTAGLDAGALGAVGGSPEAPPQDTGEA